MFSSSVKTLTQLTTLYHSEYCSKLFNLLFSESHKKHSLFLLSTINIAKKMMSDGICDDKIYDFLRAHQIKDIKLSTGFYYAQNVEVVISEVQHKYSSYNPKVYLDFGAGTATKTEQVASILQLDLEKVYALDKECFYTVENQSTKITNYLYCDGNILPKIIDKINLLTINNVFHHTENYSDLLNQLEKMYDADCLVIVKEHDCTNDMFAKLIDVEHSYYHFLGKSNIFGECIDKFYEEYSAKYFSEAFLIDLFVNRGYIHIPYKDTYTTETNNNFYVFFWKS